MLCNASIVRTLPYLELSEAATRGVLRKSVLRNFRKFTGKPLRQSLFFNTVAGLRPNLIRKETLAQVFFCEFC